MTRVIDTKTVSDREMRSRYLDGVEVVGMHSQSPAARSGIAVGDVLVRMDQRVAIGSQDQYWMTLEGFVPGQSVPYSVMRWDAETLQYRVVDFDVEIGIPPKATSENVLISDGVFGGCTLGELQPSMGGEWGFNPSKEGVLIYEMPYASYAARSGLMVGDLLLQIDGQKVETAEQVRDLSVSRSQRHHKLVIQRGDMVGEFTL